MLHLFFFFRCYYYFYASLTITTSVHVIKDLNTFTVSTNLYCLYQFKLCSFSAVVGKKFWD